MLLMLLATLEKTHTDYMFPEYKLWQEIFTIFMGNTGECLVERRLTQALIAGWRRDSIADEHEDLHTLYLILT